MRHALSLFLAVLTIFSAGFGLHMLWSDESEKTELAETFGMAWLLGTGFVSVALALFGLGINGLFLQMLVNACCLTLGTIGTRRWREKKLPGTPVPWPQGALLALIFASIGVVGFLSWRDAFVWDGILIWEAKARFAFLNNGVLPAAYFSDASRVWSHPGYPLLLPLTETWVYLWLGACDQFWIKFLFPLFYAAAVALLYTSVRRATANIRAALLTAFAFFFLPYLCFGDWGLLQGYADFPLGVLYLAAAISMQRFLQKGTPAAGARLAVLAGLLLWIKSEGLLLWLTLLSLTFCHSRARQWRWWWLPLPGLLVWSAWKIALHFLHAVADVVFMPVTPATLLHNLPRLPAIAQHLAQQLLDWREWSLLWSGCAATILFYFFKKRSSLDRTFPALFFAVLLPLWLDASVFLFSGWPTPAQYLDHVTTALPRLLFQLTPLVALVIGQRAASTFSAGH